MPNRTRLSPDELYHHGVKGMKWGVRRYQKYDGSYTRRGVERFKKVESQYDSAKKDFNSAKSRGNKAEIKSTRKAVRNAKGQMNKAYKRLKNDKLADQGKALYAQGKTIMGNNMKNRYAQVGIAVGGSIASKAVGSILDNHQAVLLTKNTAPFRCRRYHELLLRLAEQLLMQCSRLKLVPIIKSLEPIIVTKVTERILNTARR